jgi:biotin operon repressor
MHQYERLLRISTLLVREPQSTFDLADAFHVSQRTIFRDIALLRQMGMEVSYDPLDGVLRAKNHQFRDLFEGHGEALIHLLVCAYTSPLFQTSRIMWADLEMSLLSLLPRAERDFLLGLRECALGHAANDFNLSVIPSILSAAVEGTSIAIRWKEPGRDIALRTYLRDLEIEKRHSHWGVSAESSFHRRQHFFAFDDIQPMDEPIETNRCGLRPSLANGPPHARQAS